MKATRFYGFPNRRYWGSRNGKKETGRIFLLNVVMTRSIISILEYKLGKGFRALSQGLSWWIVKAKKSMRMVVSQPPIP